MWEFFYALFGTAAIGGKLAAEKTKEARGKAYCDAIKSEQKDRGVPPGGLWQTMIKPYYPEGNILDWDRRTWCYQHPRTKECYTDFAFKTEADLEHGGMTEALERHKRLARYDHVYSGVFTYLD